MSEHVERTIEMVQAQIRDLENEVSAKKRTVNDLCGLIGAPPIYSDTTPSTEATDNNLRPDRFYGKPMATVVREILERRQLVGLGAVTVNEIYDEMLSGGFHFKTKNEENAKRGLYTSLGKNSQTFHKLPNGSYGLLEWYPTAKDTKNGNGSGSPPETKPRDEKGESVEMLEETEDLFEMADSPSKPR